jgi:hypothetical protein
MQRYAYFRWKFAGRRIGVAMRQAPPIRRRSAVFVFVPTRRRRARYAARLAVSVHNLAFIGGVERRCDPHGAGNVRNVHLAMATACARTVATGTLYAKVGLGEPQMLCEATRIRLIVGEIELAGRDRRPRRRVQAEEIVVCRPERRPYHHRGKEQSVTGDPRDIVTLQHWADHQTAVLHAHEANNSERLKAFGYATSGLINLGRGLKKPKARFVKICNKMQQGKYAAASRTRWLINCHPEHHCPEEHQPTNDVVEAPR